MTLTDEYPELPGVAPAPDYGDPEEQMPLASPSGYVLLDWMRFIRGEPQDYELDAEGEWRDYSQDALY